VALPTSTGKTLLGELCLVTALQQQPGIVCYLAPYVAVGRQVAQALADHVPQTIRIRRLFGGFRDAEDVEPPLLAGADGCMEILVATPERLDALLRTAPALLSTLRCVVCDEAHLVHNDVRGIRLEGTHHPAQTFARPRGTAASDPALCSVIPARQAAPMAWGL